MVGRLDETASYVHVVDDFTLDTILTTVDTVADLAQYLERKEEFVLSGKLKLAAGEENLLAYYLRQADAEGKHVFECPPSATGVIIDDGFWLDFSKHPERLAQVDADKVSYLWDQLIEQFTKHILEDTQYFTTDATVADLEPALRFMARESRTHRRMLSKSLLAVLERADNEWRSARVAKPTFSGQPYYVFVALKPHEQRSYDEYRDVRRKLLQAYCLVTRLQFPDALDVVGIATEPRTADGRSEDLIYLDGRHWPDELANEAASLQKDLGILQEMRPLEFTEHEYPRAWQEAVPKGRNRNKACPCGSGRKFKKCHGAPSPVL